MICSGGISNRKGKITEITRISTNFKWLQVPFSFSRYRSLAYISMCRYLLFKFALPFSLARTYKRIVQPYCGFLRLCWYSKTFLRPLFTPVHTQWIPRSRDAAWIDENWTLTERRVRHLERTVLGRYLLSCHTVIRGCVACYVFFRMKFEFLAIFLIFSALTLKNKIYSSRWILSIFSTKDH